jgi:hypothetical protein
VAIWPWAVAVAIAVDALTAASIGTRWLPADRVADAGWLAVVLAAAVAVARLADILAARTRLGPVAMALGILVVAGAAALDGRTLTVWPRRVAYPGLADVERGLRLDALWSALRRDPGTRVLFTRSGVPLVYGTDWWRPHSHATALTPIRAGRPIVHGTFTHPSPIAAFVYRGDTGPGAIDMLAERLDGRALFGRALPTLDAATFTAVTDRLGVGAVVVLDEDLPSLTALTGNDAFERDTAVGPFTVYRRRNPTRLPIPETPTRWRLDARGSAGDWVPAGFAYYPLWSAERAGRPLATRRGELWRLEVQLDEGAGPVELIYRPGAWEKAGLAITAAALAAWLIAVVSAGRRRQPPRAAGLTR